MSAFENYISICSSALQRNCKLGDEVSHGLDRNPHLVHADHGEEVYKTLVPDALYPYGQIYGLSSALLNFTDIRPAYDGFVIEI